MVKCKDVGKAVRCGQSLEVKTIATLILMIRKVGR